MDGKSTPAPRIGTARAAAVLEVAGATTLVLAAYKALKLVEPAGQNFAPGAVMIVAAAGLARLGRRDGVELGSITPTWRFSLGLGLLAAALLLPLRFIQVPGAPGAWWALLALASGASLVVGITLARPQDAARRRSGFPVACSAFLLVGLVALPIAMATFAGVSPAAIASTVVGRLLFTAFGEELFFRGYVLSRLDGAFGRPVRVLRAPCGVGLWLSSVLFGAIHLMNPARPFSGEWDLAWSWGATAFASGLVFAWLRERTSSVWASVVLHGVLGTYQGMYLLWIVSPR